MNINDWQPRQLGGQLSLFPLNPAELLAEVEVSLEDLRRWHKESWLSFDPATVTEYQPWHVAEIRFISGILNSGLPRETVACLLSGLPKPYRYDPDLTAFNFARSEWQQLPALTMTELRDSFRKEFLKDMEFTLRVHVAELVENGDFEMLHQLRATIDDGLKVARRDNEQAPLVEIRVGDKLDGKYVITRSLGGGGFGDVFLANDERLPDRQVAIKVLSNPLAHDHSALEREMQLLANFHHPHVVTLYHHFTHESRLCMVMEFCVGGNLDRRLRTAGRFPPEQVFAWGLELCETLALVHGRGIAHHDIKPLNLFFTADGTLKLGDFGVANTHVGTIAYMPPEMLLGERVSRKDPRIDLYSLGLTLLELITGCHPFAGLHRNDAIQARIRHDFIPDDLPKWVQEVLLKATHPTPEMRFQCAQDFAEAIRGRHVPYVFDGTRIRAAALARKAETAMARKKWRTAEKTLLYALAASPDCVPALLAAGRCELLLHRIDRARNYFSRALAISPRTPVQKELGWIRLEQGQIPAAISLLTDHLHRNASDYEGYNLLLKCFFLTNRYEAAQSLARTTMAENAPSTCFRNNDILCRLLQDTDPEADKLTSRESEDPFIAYNLQVARERPPAWSNDTPTLKSKLMFEEYRFGLGPAAARPNIMCVDLPSGVRQAVKKPLVALGSLESNDIVLTDRSVSRRHCVILNYQDDLWLYDLGSSVGTRVDGDVVHGCVRLEGFHKVEVGDVVLGVAVNRSIIA